MLQDINLAGVDTQRPLLPGGDYHLRFEEYEQVDSKSVAGGYNLVVTFTNVDPVQTTKGKSIAPGKLKFKKYLPLQSKEGSDYDFRTGLSQFSDALTGNEDENARPTFNAEFLNETRGAVVVGRITLERMDDGSETNSVGSVWAPRG